MVGENGPQLPMPEDVARNLANVFPGATESELAERLAPYPDVETFLEKNGPMYETIDKCWRSTNTARKTFEEVAGAQVVAVKVEDASGHTRLGLKGAEGLTSRRERRQERQTGMNPRLSIAISNRDGYDFAIKFAKSDLFRTSAQYVEGDELQQMLTMVGQKQLLFGEESSRQFLEGDTDEIRHERTRQVYALNTVYMQTFVGQTFGIAKLRRVFDDDNLVLPFLSRLEEIAAVSAQGLVEFPGLLETIQAHIAECKNTGKSNMLEGALERVQQQVLSIQEFTEEVVLGDEDPKRIVPQASEEFFAGARALRAAIKILGQGENPADPQQIAALISQHIEEMPRDWQKAYKNAADQRIATIWNRVSLALQKFDRPGRLRANVTDKGFEQAYYRQGSSNTRKRKGNPKTNNPQPTNALVAAVADIVNEAPKTPASFAILKSTGSTNDVYRLEEPGTVDDLMTSQMVTKFLTAHAGLDESLRAFFERIAVDPYHDPGVKVLQTGSFQLLGQKGFRKYALRRFRPVQVSNETDSTSDLVRRVRILYGIGAISGSTCVMVQNLDIRNPKTYK